MAKCPALATATSASFGGGPSGGSRPNPPRQSRKSRRLTKPGVLSPPLKEASPPMTCPPFAPAACCPPPPPPLHTPSQVGSLSRHIQAWEEVQTSRWIIRMIRSGYRLPWDSPKVPLTSSPPIFQPLSNP